MLFGDLQDSLILGIIYGGSNTRLEFLSLLLTNIWHRGKQTHRIWNVNEEVDPSKYKPITLNIFSFKRKKGSTGTEPIESWTVCWVLHVGRDVYPWRGKASIEKQVSLGRAWEKAEIGSTHVNSGLRRFWNTTFVFKVVLWTKPLRVFSTLRNDVFLGRSHWPSYRRVNALNEIYATETSLSDQLADLGEERQLAKQQQQQKKSYKN